MNRRALVTPSVSIKSDTCGADRRRDPTPKHSLDNVVSMTVFIKESRYGDKFVEMRKDFFKNGNYPGSALITVTNFARPGIEIEIQAVGVIGDTCSNDNPCSAEGKAKKAQK